ncbi:hypothetical protein HBB16_05530 [Pseudonocardia sp. MCCB 268]|nr:hypothetical protein [Pseudonocardia cytotoxica]
MFVVIGWVRDPVRRRCRRIHGKPGTGRGGAEMRWETRTVPAGSGASAAGAAVRSDGPLAVTTAELGIALLLYLAVAVTGWGSSQPGCGRCSCCWP